jgi:hypothetical protein
MSRHKSLDISSPPSLLFPIIFREYFHNFSRRKGKLSKAFHAAWKKFTQLKLYAEKQIGRLSYGPRFISQKELMITRKVQQAQCSLPVHAHKKGHK